MKFIMAFIFLCMSYSSFAIESNNAERECYIKSTRIFTFKIYPTCEACLDKNKKCAEYCGDLLWRCTYINTENNTPNSTESQ